MVMLTVLACLASDPMSGRSLSLPFDGGPVTCALHGQMAAAEWAASHPKWRVQRWTCGRREVRS